MNDLALHKAFTEQDIQTLEAGMLQYDQADCPVTHYFGPGVYIREVELPANTVVVGHSHKSAHLNVMLCGRLTMIGLDGSRRELVAPQTLMSEPGRKIAQIHETVRWQNIYATDETDVERLEELLFEKSETYQLTVANQLLLRAPNHLLDHADYHTMIGEHEDTVLAWSHADQIEFPPGGYKVMVSSSTIHGRGLFATGKFKPYEQIAPARIGGRHTPAWRYANHSAQPNAEMMPLKNGDIDLVALAHIGGCKGGYVGDEITVDYRQTLSVGETSCQL